MTQHKAIKPQRTVSDPDWWRGAVIYQIYPRSFQDSTGDGSGDLAGITSRLDYVAELGVDAIWISPFFKSPMKDFGYDVSDYTAIDPLFGSMADFDALVARAHDLGLKVMIDLVLSHTSDAHPWFEESRRDRNNARADWYVWADAKPDGSPPNNWLSIFGGSAWAWDGRRMQYYLHNFLTEQPDLNFHNPQVQDALLDVTRYWLDRGVDGFRLDTINFYFHDRELRDNPPLPEEARNTSIAPAVNPYNWQDHLYDKNQPENLAFLRRFRALLDAYPAATAVGEVGCAQRGPEIQAQYTAGGDKVHMCYDFGFLAPERLTGTKVARVMRDFETLSDDGWACWAFSNHDVARHTTRWTLDRAALRVHLALLLALRGSVCLYQGEELGLAEADVAYDDLQDPYGIAFWPEYKGRDGCRTPMVWENDNTNSGFSAAENTWLPIDPRHRQQAVSKQSTDPSSHLQFYRKMLAFRARYPSLAKGNFELVSADDEVIAFIRSDQTERLFCAFNLGADAKELTWPKGNWEVLETDCFTSRSGALGAHQALFARDLGEGGKNG